MPCSELQPGGICRALTALNNKQSLLDGNKTILVEATSLGGPGMCPNPSIARQLATKVIVQSPTGLNNEYELDPCAVSAANELPLYKSHAALILLFRMFLGNQIVPTKEDMQDIVNIT